MGNGKFKNAFLNTSETLGSVNAGVRNIGNVLGSGSGTKNAWLSGGAYQTGVGTGLRGAGELAGAAGPYGQVAGSALSSISDMVDLFGYRPEVSQLKNQYSAYKPPSYDLTEEKDAASSIVGNFTQDANKKIISSSLKGAAAGAVFGPLGAGIGAAVGAGGAFLGKVFGKKKAEEAESQMQNQINIAQNRFNEAQTGFYERENAMEKYEAKKNYSRSLYNFPTQSPYMYT